MSPAERYCENIRAVRPREIDPTNRLLPCGTQRSDVQIKLTAELEDAIRGDEVGTFMLRFTMSRRRLSVGLLRKVITLASIQILEALLAHYRASCLNLATPEQMLLWACWSCSERRLGEVIGFFERTFPGVCARSVDPSGRTALHYLWMNGTLSTEWLALVLTERGCDPKRVCDDGRGGKACYDDLRSVWFAPYLVLD